MNRKIEHIFTENIPRELEEGKLYISITHKTTIHRCFCGCSEEVVAPIGIAEWELTFNGEGVSLNPSIGNWNLPCKSHYWIKENQVFPAEKWQQDKIDMAKAIHQKRRDALKGQTEKKQEQILEAETSIAERTKNRGFIRELFQIIKEIFQMK